MNTSCQKVSYAHEDGHSGIPGVSPALATHEICLEGGNAFKVYLGMLDQAKKLGSMSLEAITMDFPLAFDCKPGRCMWVALNTGFPQPSSILRLAAVTIAYGTHFSRSCVHSPQHLYQT